MKKNPLSLAFKCYRTWHDLSSYPGVFSFRDACMQLRYVLQPERFTERELMRFIEKELKIEAKGDKIYEVRVRHNDIVFYWAGKISGGLASGVVQELDPDCPHYYTTPPVRLARSSIVLDVGACEGLFALRVSKAEQVDQVICFEPSASSATYLRRAAEANGVAHKIQIANSAVGKQSRDVFFTNLDSPEANHVVYEEGPGTARIRQVCLDDYCRENGLRLKEMDLIKVDAEGADVDVIRGAEGIIREYSPQIAVTTYHDPGHAAQLIEFLRKVQPRYCLRLKGLTLWETKTSPRPVLLQASVLSA